MTEFVDEKDAYALAYRLALKNVSDWLEIAKSATLKGLYGQSYSLAITAYEELGKAYISWLAAMEFIQLEEEILELVYYKHEVKTFVSDLISIEDAMILALSTGIIDTDDILEELSLSSEEERFGELGVIAFEREQRRRKGMYVDVWEEDSGKFTVTSPDDFNEGRANSAIEEVARTLEILELLVKLTAEYPEIYKHLKSVYEERRNTYEEEPNN
ncbi:MAG: AbiV family abortive infection protein [Candidatus Thorarchaeota archaeon]